MKEAARLVHRRTLIIVDPFDIFLGNGEQMRLPRFICAHTGLGAGYRASVVLKNGHDLYARVTASGTVILLR